MDTRAMAREIRLLHWAELINERSASGKTVIEWCAGKGISTKTYYYRQNQLRLAAYTKSGGGLVPKDFAEVRIPQKSMAGPFSGALSQGKVRIEAAGLLITADSAYPAANIAEIVRGMTAPC